MQRRRVAGQASVAATAAASIAACALIHLTLSAMLAAGPVSQDVAETDAPSGPFPTSANVFRSEESVVAHRPYRPTHKGWSRRVFPVGGAAAGRDTDCVAWRQTGSCRPDGPREAFFDLPCDKTVQSGKSGYCQCGGNVHKGGVRCQRYPSFTCADVCANRVDPSAHAAGADGEDMGDLGQDDDGGAEDPSKDVLRRAREHGHVFIDGRKAVPYQPSPHEVAAEKARRRRRQGSMAGSHRRLAEQPVPSDPATVSCYYFQQTRGCSPHGAPEAHRRGCDDLVPSGASGYCVCGGGYKGPGVGCDHPPFSCRDGCDPRKAAAVDEQLLGPAHPTATGEAPSKAQTPPDGTPDEDAAAVEAARERAHAHFRRQLTYATPASGPARVLDAVQLTDADTAEMKEIARRSRERAAEIRRVDAARRAGDNGPTRAFVAGGGPAILHEHAAFDADVARRIAEATVDAQRAASAGPSGARKLSEASGAVHGNRRPGAWNFEAPSSAAVAEQLAAVKRFHADEAAALVPVREVAEDDRVDDDAPHPARRP